VETKEMQLKCVLSAAAAAAADDVCGVVLQGSHQGGPQLCLSEVCRDCLRQQLQGLVSSDTLADLRDQLLCQLAKEEDDNAAAGIGEADMPGYYVSKTWLKGFRMRQGTAGGSLQPPTAGEPQARHFR
jgi:hypothetical protein